MLDLHSAAVIDLNNKKTQRQFLLQLAGTDPLNKLLYASTYMNRVRSFTVL